MSYILYKPFKKDLMKIEYFIRLFEPGSYLRIEITNFDFDEIKNSQKITPINNFIREFFI